MSSEIPVSQVKPFCHLNQCRLAGIAPGASSFFSTS